MPATGPVILQMIFMSLADVQSCVGKAVPTTINVKGDAIIRLTVSVHGLC